MHIPSGLVIESQAVLPQEYANIPVHLIPAAQHCAANGIPLHDDRNPSPELRQWARKQRLYSEAYSGVSTRIPKAYGAAEQRKAALKLKRKLQKKHGVR